MTQCYKVSGRAVTVADFYHHGGNGPTTAGRVVLYMIFVIPEESLSSKDDAQESPQTVC